MKRLVIIIPVAIFILSLLISFKSVSHKQKSETFFGKFNKEFCLNNICIYNDGTDWVYNDNGKIIPTDNELVEIYTKRLSDLKITDEVSNNTEKFIEFGFDNDPLFLSMNGKKLEIGNLKNDLSGTYVRREKGKIVYFVPNINLDKDSIRKSDYWNKKFVLNLSETAVKNINVIKDNQEKKYIPENNEFMNDAKTANILRLKIVNFIDNIEPKENIEKIIFKLEMSDKNIELNVGKTKEGKYWVATDNKFYYEISKDTYDSLTEMSK